MEKDDQYYMDICNRLAEKAGLKGNPAAGALIVQNGIVVARAGEASETKGDITSHAEIEAIRKAVKKIGPDLSQCVLYTTHEPCVMCAYPIRYHAIGKIVIRSAVKFFAGTGTDFPLLITDKVPAHWSPPPEIKWLAGAPD